MDSTTTANNSGDHYECNLSNIIDLNTTHEDIGYTFIPEPVPFPAKLLLSVTLMIVSVAACLINLLTVFVFIRYPKPITFTTVSVISLAVSDLIATASISPVEAALLWYDYRWKLGHFACKLIPFLQSMAVISSICILGCIAIDRYRGIVRALRSQRPRMYIVAFSVGAIWVIALLFSIPMLFMFGVMKFIAFNESDGRKCELMEICVPLFFQLDRRRSYTLVIYLTIVPVLIIIVFCYVSVGHFLWIRKPVSDSTTLTSVAGPSTSSNGGTNDSDSLTCKKKIIKTLMKVTVIFICCRMPLNTYGVLQQFIYIENSPLQRVIREILVILSLVNGAANPFLYCLFHEKLRTMLVGQPLILPVRRNPRLSKTGRSRRY